MLEIISTSEHVAKKEYNCDSSEWLLEYVRDEGRLPRKITFAEKRLLVIAQREKFKILPGAKYIRQAGKYDYFYVVRMRPEIHKICCKYELYPEV